QSSTNVLSSGNQFASFSNSPQFSNQLSVAGSPVVQPVRGFTIDFSREIDDDDSREILLLNQNRNNAFRNTNQFQLNNVQAAGQFRVVPDLTDEVFDDDSREIFLRTSGFTTARQLLNPAALTPRPRNNQGIVSGFSGRSQQPLFSVESLEIINNRNNAFRNTNQFQLNNVQAAGQFRVVPDLTDEVFDDDSREIFLRTSGFTTARQLLNPAALTPRPRNNQGTVRGVSGSFRQPLFSVESLEFTNERFDTTNERFDITNERFDDSNERFDDSNERFGLFSQRFLRPNVRTKRDFRLDSPESHENDFMTKSIPKPMETRVRNFQQYNFDTIGSHENDFMSGESLRVLSADLGSEESGNGEVLD
ncbi:unnamed protein product, partial [Meganyctiphanes norvegica]